MWCPDEVTLGLSAPDAGEPAAVQLCLPYLGRGQGGGEGDHAGPVWLPVGIPVSDPRGQMSLSGLLDSKGRLLIGSCPPGSHRAHGTLPPASPGFTDGRRKAFTWSVVRNIGLICRRHGAMGEQNCREKGYGRRGRFRDTIYARTLEDYRIMSGHAGMRRQLGEPLSVYESVRRLSATAGPRPSVRRI